MAGKLAHVMNVTVLADILKDNTPAHEIVEDLFVKGMDLAHEIQPRTYANFDAFKVEHLSGKTELVELEGDSSIYGELIILHGCPMFDEVKKLYTDGKAPAHHEEILASYSEQNPGSHALLHPGCIVHQIARQVIVKMAHFEDGTDLNFYQIACRSMGTGKVVYDDVGMSITGIDKAMANKLIDGYACLYALVKS